MRAKGRPRIKYLYHKNPTAWSLHSVGMWLVTHHAQSVGFDSHLINGLRLYIDNGMVLTLHRQVGEPHSTKLTFSTHGLRCECMSNLADLGWRQAANVCFPHPPLRFVMPLCLVEHPACLSCFTQGMMLLPTTFPTAISTRSGRQTLHKEHRVPQVGFLARIRLINGPETPNSPSYRTQKVVTKRLK